MRVAGATARSSTDTAVPSGSVRSRRGKVSPMAMVLVVIVAAPCQYRQCGCLSMQGDCLIRKRRRKFMAVEEDLADFSAGVSADLGRLLVLASAVVNERVIADLDPTGASGVRLAHVPLIAALDPEGTRMVDLA